MTFEEFIREWNNSEEYIVAQTSGSTGAPKEIRLPKRFVEESAKRTIDFFGLNKDSRLHSCVGADFIGGKMMAVRSQIADCRFTFETPSNLPLKDLTSAEVIDLLAVVPSQIHNLLTRLDTLPTIKNIIIGGSAIHPDLRNKIAESDLNCYETYGMTETASHIALKKLSNKETPFKLLRGIKIKKNDKGCLKIIFENGVEIETNDLVEILSDTEFFVLGRKDNIIISGGKKINPFELERKVSRLIPSDFYFTGLPDEKWGEKLVLRIEGNNSLDKKILKDQLKEILKPWEMPKEIEITEKLPRTPNGKLLRNMN